MVPYNARKEDEFMLAYERHFAGLTPSRVLEIGVQGGGSLKIWRDMFPEAEIVGVDIDASCKQHEGKNITVEIGDQEDVEFLEELGDFDIIIDDGGHTMKQQQVSFETLFPKLSKGGLYVIEDLHTSYWRQFSDSDITTIEFLKSLVDDLHTYAVESSRCEIKPNIRDRFGIIALHFYKGIVFIQK